MPPGPFRRSAVAQPEGSLADIETFVREHAPRASAPGRSGHRHHPTSRASALAYGGIFFSQPGAEQGPGTRGGVVTWPLAEMTVMTPTLGGGPGGRLPNEVQPMLT
jgi:hypothetical protein